MKVLAGIIEILDVLIWWLVIQVLGVLFFLLVGGTGPAEIYNIIDFVITLNLGAGVFYVLVACLGFKVERDRTYFLRAKRREF